VFIFERTGKMQKIYVKGRGLIPALEVGEQFRLKILIRPVISFDPNPSIRIVSWGLAIFIMSCHPTAPMIIMARDPDSFPSAWNPFTSRFPVARNIFLLWRVIRFWPRGVNDPRRKWWWKGMKAMGNQTP